VKPVPNPPARLAVMLTSDIDVLPVEKEFAASWPRRFPPTAISSAKTKAPLLTLPMFDTPTTGGGRASVLEAEAARSSAVPRKAARLLLTYFVFIRVFDLLCVR
jgi:hypothetical protein